MVHGSPGFQSLSRPDCCGNTHQEGMRVNTEIEIDLGLARVSEGALAMLEGASGAASLPPNLFSKLLDALAEEHLRRFGAQMGATVMLKMPTRTLDADELWHSLRMLGHWLSNTEAASHSDPDLEAASEVVARMWLGMRGALSLVVDGPVEQAAREAHN
jgi:hypothetical protein